MPSQPSPLQTATGSDWPWVVFYYVLLSFNRLEIFKMLLASFSPLLVLILAVLGSIVFGLTTPTEAAVSPPHVTLNQIFAGMMPFMGIQVLAIFLLYQFPAIGLWLPRLLYK